MNILNLIEVLCTIVASVGLGITWLWRKLRPTIQLTHRLAGSPGDEAQGIASRPGILERTTQGERRDEQAAALLAEFGLMLGEFRADLAVIKSQVTNNGGHSVKDVGEQTLAVVQQMAESRAAS